MVDEELKMAYLNALDADSGWVVVYVTMDEVNWTGPSSSLWIVPGTISENARW